MYKIFSLAAVLAIASAGPVRDGATSFSSFNENHNSIQHIDSAPVATKYFAPATPVLSKTIIVPTSPVAKVGAATFNNALISKTASPATYTYSAPTAKLAVPEYKYTEAPLAKIAVPETKYSSGPSYKAQYEEEYGPAQYEFAYVVEDSNTGDYHSQEEKRNGDHVVGQYSLHEADGTIRIVKYYDDGHGFNAVVEKQGNPTEAPAYKQIEAVATPHYY